MIEKTRSLLKSILLFFNFGTIIAYLSVCFVPFINTGKYWFFAFPGLVFPLIFFALICYIILWAFLRSKWFYVSLIVMLLGIQQIITVFSFHLPKNFSADKPPNTLRVLQWNVSSWDETHKVFNQTKKSDNYRSAMMSLVKARNADVLCFEEFFESSDTNYFTPNISTIVGMGFPYYYFVPTADYKNDFRSGIAIFSRYPMIDSAKFNFKRNEMERQDKNDIGEHLIYTDIKVGDSIFRIYATHLQSVHFDQADYVSLSRLKRARDPGFSDSRTIVSKLKRGYISRFQQAELIEQKVAESPYPKIICGDFNDVPNSSTYFKIKGNMQDAFLRKGFFIGRSFRFISPTLRIDYILADKRFKVNQFQTIHVPYSDHYPLETDLQY